MESILWNGIRFSTGLDFRQYVHAMGPEPHRGHGLIHLVLQTHLLAGKDPSPHHRLCLSIVLDFHPLL